MKIAILGATSHIAQDLILSFSQKKSYSFSLFTRNVRLLEKWISNVNLGEEYQAQSYIDFNNANKYDVVINFVGIGDPEKAQRMGDNILKITKQYDDMVLEYIRHNKKTKYIFLSSGAVFGGDYQEPVNKNTVAMIDVNNLNPTDWYAIAKLYAEAKHRSLPNLSIVDVRVFNYFSHTQNMNARFLITDIVRSLKNKEVFRTSADNVVRDFITPPDFYHLIQTVIDYDPINTALDCYTNAPVAKLDLLLKLKEKFGLEYQIEKSINIVNATGVKFNYYSTNTIAKSIKYNPKNNSLDGIIKELSTLFSKHKT
jgi:nucleoside-diphosphate-sugar epimerase